MYSKKKYKQKGGSISEIQATTPVQNIIMMDETTVSEALEDNSKLVLLVTEAIIPITLLSDARINAVPTGFSIELNDVPAPVIVGSLSAQVNVPVAVVP